MLDVDGDLAARATIRERLLGYDERLVANRAALRVEDARSYGDGQDGIAALSALVDLEPRLHAIVVMKDPPGRGDWQAQCG
jgi:hypothetical protein